MTTALIAALRPILRAGVRASRGFDETPGKGFSSLGLIMGAAIGAMEREGLDAAKLHAQAYKVSAESGGFFLWDAGEGPTGDIVGFSREESATDVASELTQLIQTQRAYSSNAKIIQTVDEMWQETTNIKR